MPMETRSTAESPACCRSQPRPKIFPSDGDEGHKKDEKNIKLRKEVYLDGDRRKIERYENRVDHLGEDLSHPFGKRLGVSDHNPGQKKPKQAGQPHPLGDNPAQQSQASTQRSGLHRVGAGRRVTRPVSARSTRRSPSERQKAVKPTAVASKGNDRTDTQRGRRGSGKDEAENHPSQNIVSPHSPHRVRSPRSLLTKSRSCNTRAIMTMALIAIVVPKNRAQGQPLIGGGEIGVGQKER